MSDTVAILTPPGRSALATLSATGPGVWEVVRRHFRCADGGTLPERPVAGRFRLGRLGAELADEVVLAVIEADPVRVEVHGHGGEEVSRCLVELFTHSFSSDPEGSAGDALPSGSLLNECASLLPHAPTTRTASIILDQLAGAWERDVAAARSSVAARAALEALAARWHVGRHVVEPFRVVIAGAPNVGKSSLANAVAGYQRSIVSPTPGTTRDLVSTDLAVEGWPIVLTDTAGIRLAGGDLEGRGIEQARGVIAEADIVLWILDASNHPVWPDSSTPTMHFVINKTDLPPAWDAAGVEAMRVSAATGEGMPELIAAFAAWLVPEVPPPGAGVPLTAGQVEEVRRMLDEMG